ncbi:unnamed protein product [Ectocarpus sp. 13 AM-2016]
MCGELLSRESSGGRVSGTSTPLLSSSVSVSRDSPRGSAGSVEDFGTPATIGAADMNGGGGMDRPLLTRGRSSSSSGIGGGGAAATVLDSGGGARSGGGAGALHRGGMLGNMSGNGTGNGGVSDDGELPSCLVGILDSFLGGGGKSYVSDGNGIRSGSGGSVGNNNANEKSGNNNGAAPPLRSPSTITGIEMEVGRSAFARLGERGLDDIKDLSGAGISAPESPEGYGHLSDEAVAAMGAVYSSAARGNAPCDGVGLAAANAAAAAAATAAAAAAAAAAASNKAVGAGQHPRGKAAGFGRGGSMSSGSSSSASTSSPFEGFGLKEGVRANTGGGATTTSGAIAAVTGGVSRLGLGTTKSGGGGGNGVSPSLSSAVGQVSGGLAAGGGGGGGTAGPNSLKTVKITGTAEEVQLAEYLIRVRTTGGNMAAAS